jgi:SAM-dependent methyltransferase
MDLQQVQANWNEFGARDPFWAVCTAPDKKGNRWDVDEFFQTGAEEVDRVMARLGEFDWRIERRRALDFGCGVGRLTRRLAHYFTEVWGVDIAPSMIEQANRHNCHPDRCRFVVNAANDLGTFPDSHFDLVYSNMVLQHMEPRYALAYVREFLRVLVPGGLAVFQVPSAYLPPPEVVPRRPDLKGLVKNYLLPRAALEWYRAWRRRPAIPAGKGEPQPVMEMNGIERRAMVDHLTRIRARIVAVMPDESAGREWSSFQYWVSKD